MNDYVQLLLAAGFKAAEIRTLNVMQLYQIAGAIMRDGVVVERELKLLTCGNSGAAGAVILAMSDIERSELRKRVTQ